MRIATPLSTYASVVARLAPADKAEAERFDGSFDDAFEDRAPVAMLGALEVGRAKPRRGRAFLKGRRTRFQMRRRTGKLTAATPVHRGEREIIARD